MKIRKYEKDCENCLHWRCAKSQLPCRDCVGKSKWEAER